MSSLIQWSFGSGVSPLRNRNEFEAQWRRILKKLKRPQRTLELRLVKSSEMKKFNHRFRGKNKPTDVLSFPLDSGPLQGSLLIDVQTARLQAAQYGHSPRREIQELFTHGCLHLLGFDHEKSSQARTMARWENFFNRHW